MLKRKGGARPPSAKKSKSNHATSAQVSDSAETVLQPVFQQPPAEKPDHPTSAHSDADMSDLGLLQRFWEAAWGKEPFKDALKDSEGNNIEYLNFKEHLPAVSIICPTVPNNGKLCIFQEYVEAFSTFKSDPDGAYGKGACIIGQPGIGKSCFIAYAVVERLQKKLPVAVQYTVEQYWLFAADGVSFHADRAPLRQHSDIWAFSDSNVDVIIPAAAFRGTLGVRTFQTTAPQTARYEEWTKQALVRYYFMNLPSEKDIENFSLVGDRDVERMQRLARKWGNVPRTLIDIYDDRGEQAEARYKDIVRVQVHKSARELENILSALGNSAPSMTDEASTVYFIRPSREGDLVQRGLHDMFVPTEWLQDQFIDRLFG